jgi:hypothetical protein
MADPAHENTETADSWAHTLELIAKEQAQTKATERTGRGVRRKAAIYAENQVWLVASVAISRCTYFSPTEVRLFGPSRQTKTPREEAKKIKVHSV